MTRILCSTLTPFDLSTIYSADTRTDTAFQEPGASGLTKNRAAADRADYLHAHFAVTDATGAAAPPDLVVLLGLACDSGQPGRLATGGGVQAAGRLLRWIRGKTGNAKFMLVPPVRTGPRESVAIVYDSAAYAFTGPWRWPGGEGPAFDPATARANATGAYPANLTPYLGPTAVPTGAARNAGQPQNRLAPGGRLTYRSGHAQAGRPAYDPDFERLPYWVTFAELGGTGVTRELSLFAVHAPASGAARHYLARASQTAEIADKLAADEVRVVLGDFNLDLMAATPAMELAAEYQALAQLGFRLGIDRPGDPPGSEAYAGYFTTLMRARRDAQWYGAAYPGYGFADRRDAPPSGDKRATWAIDNIIARHGAGAGGPIRNATILNGISGAPYDRHGPAPGNAPVGVYRFPIATNDAAFAAPPATTPAGTEAEAKAFRSWVNYGRIRSTSGHFALMADV